MSLALSKIRKAARILLTMPEKDPRRIFQVGKAAEGGVITGAALGRDRISGGVE